MTTTEIRLPKASPAIAHIYTPETDVLESIQLNPPATPQTYEDIVGPLDDEPRSDQWQVWHLYERPHWYRDLMENPEFTFYYEVGVTHYRDFDAVSLGNRRTFHRDYLTGWKDLMELLIQRGIYQATEPRQR